MIRDFITVEQLQEILKEVYENHEWAFNGRKIKYVYWSYDNRKAAIFYVEFKCVGSNKAFTLANRGEEEVNLYNEVMEWLITGRDNKGRVPPRVNGTSL